MGWYEYFSHGYDLATERVYRSYRDKAVTRLDPGVGTTVLDLPCGTGQAFPQLLERLGDEARIIGIDGSAGMLARARRRVARCGWQEKVALIEADARTIEREHLRTTTSGVGQVDYVVSFLGLCVLPDWESVFEKMFGFLRPGGQFLIMDVWAEKRVPQTLWVELVARADLRRKVWEPLEACSENFELQFLAGSPHIHGGRVFAATGRRPLPTSST